MPKQAPMIYVIFSVQFVARTLRLQQTAREIRWAAVLYVSMQCLNCCQLTD